MAMPWGTAWRDLVRKPFCEPIDAWGGGGFSVKAGTEGTFGLGNKLRDEIGRILAFNWIQHWSAPHPGEK